MQDAPSPDTLAAHGGHAYDASTGAVVPPIHPSTTYSRGAQYELLGDHLYSRYSHPIAKQVEQLATELDGGAAALAFTSGMSGIVALFETVASGRHIVAPRVMYHGAQAWLRRIAERRAIGLTLFDAQDPQGLERAIRPGETDLVWIESPVNPTWDVIDIERAAQIAHGAGALFAVDSTVAPPMTTKALALGADFVFHSASKYYNGHSDVLAGLLVAARVDARWEEVQTVRNFLGGLVPPFEGWLLLRGMRTLPLRFRAASASAMAIARHFEGHAALESVLYPGLESHPGHAIAARQMTDGFGGMLSLLVRGGAKAARALATGTRVFLPATSLGGVESLIEHRAAVEGPDSVVPQNLLRLSVGIECTEDLIADLESALA